MFPAPNHAPQREQVRVAAPTRRCSTLRRSTGLACLGLMLAAAVVEAGSPRLVRVTPPGGQRGTTVEVYLNGRYLTEPQEVVFYEPGITVESIEALEGEVEINGRKERVEAGTRVRVRLKLADDCVPGLHSLRLRTATGVTELQRFFVGPFPTVEEDEPNQKRNDKLDAAKELPLNCTVVGRMNDPPDVDTFRIVAQQGKRISAEIEAARIGVERGVPDLHLSILDEQGKLLAETDDSSLYIQDPVLSLIADRDGPYFVQVRHSVYNAGGETYRMHVGTFPRPLGIYPAGGPAGTELAVQVLGDPRGPWSTTVRLPSTGVEYPLFAADTGATAAETGIAAPSPNFLRISPFPNVLESEPNDDPAAAGTAAVVELPVAFNGVIEKPGDVDCFRFRAKQGERFKVHALANALGSPLDPTIWIKSADGKGATLRATEARPNQLGIPQTGGLNRDTLDPVLEFTVPADGEYVLGVEDDRGDGSSTAVYRVEFQPETDAVYTYITPEPDNVFTPQVRQAIAVAAGNRYNVQVGIFNSNRPFNGELELYATGLPDGVTMSAPKFGPGVNRVPVVFEAADGVIPQAKFIELMVRPLVPPKVETPVVDGTPAANATAPAAGAQPPEVVPALASGYRQVIPMNQYANADYYLHHVVDKLLLAVTNPAPFHIVVEEPKSALVQNGEMPLKFTVQRAPGYEGPVTVSLEWRPNGVNTSTPVTIPEGKTEGEYLLGAARNATAGAYQVVLTAISGGAKTNYNDQADRTYVASQPFRLTVAEPHLEGRFARTSVERGKTAQIVCKLNHLKPFQGKAKATLTRLPRGVQLVEPQREISSEDKTVEFTVLATEDCLVGSYQGLALDVTVFEDGQAMRQLSGSGMLRIEPERGPRVSSK